MGRKAKKGKKVDFNKVLFELEKLEDSKGIRRFEISQCPSDCPRIAEQKNCTPQNCIEIQKQIDADEDTLRAFDIATGVSKPAKIPDTGLRGNPAQRSRKFLTNEIYEGKIRDAARCYRILEYEDTPIGEAKIEIFPTCRTTIYGRRGKTETVIVMLETTHELDDHIRRHGKPLNVWVSDTKRRICLRDCKACYKGRRFVFDACKEYELRVKCEGCESRKEAHAFVRKWFNNEYCPSIGIDANYLPFSTMRYVARPMTKSKGEKWL